MWLLLSAAQVLVQDLQLQALGPGPGLVPPDLGRTTAIGIDDHLARLAAGLAHHLFAGKPQGHPDIQLAAQAFLPDVRLVISGKAFGHREVLVCVQRKSDYAQHQPFVRLRRMLGDGQFVGLIIVAIHVRD